MYNYSANLTYKDSESDTIYRKEILDCLNEKEFSINITKKTDKLYDEHEDKYNKILKALKDKGDVLYSNLPNKGLFLVLFSWDYWFENHLYLQSLQKGDINEINLRENELLNKIVGLGK